jgi:hypothetical protein
MSVLSMELARAKRLSEAIANTESCRVDINVQAKRISDCLIAVEEYRTAGHIIELSNQIDKWMKIVIREANNGV